MQKVKFELIGEMPLLMHADDVMRQDELEEARKALREKGDKSKQKAGDDRFPPWSWQVGVYHDGEKLAIPQEVVMACLRGGGARKIMARQKTYKEATQSSVFPATEHFRFEFSGRSLPVSEMESIRDLPFSEQVAWARGCGFDLFVKRARIGQAKHVRVRARFDDWTIRGEFQIDETVVPIETLREILNLAGRVGIGDWRPGGKTPGPYGTFTAKVTRA